MRAAEFYSGIGGLHYSLLQACSEAEVVAAFDINLLANKVYEHNFGMKPGQVSRWSARIIAIASPERLTHVVCV